MSSIERFNPAQRLLEIVNKLKAMDQVKPIWKCYLEIDGNGTDIGDAYLVASELIKLSREVEEIIMENPDINKELLSDLKPLLQSFLKGSLEAPISSSVGKCKGDSVVALKHYSILFEMLIGEKRVSTNNIEQASSKIQELFQDVKFFEDKELKEILLAILESARRSISLYHINGAASFKDVFDLAIGKLSVQYVKKKPDKEFESTTVRKVAHLMHYLAKMASDANAIIALPQGVQDCIKALVGS